MTTIGDEVGNTQVKLANTNMHLREKSMWAGSNSKVNDNIYGMIPSEGFPGVLTVTLQLPHVPSLMKSLAELISNAVDQAVKRKGDARHAVTLIEGTFNENGFFRIYNNGAGIPIEAVPPATLEGKYRPPHGGTVYTPEVIFGVPFAGTNLDETKGRVSGGTNGLGAKIANAHSLYFRVETCSVNHGTRLMYTQDFRNHMTEVSAPVICQASAGSTDFTCVTTRLEFELREYASMVAGSRDWNELDMWLRFQFNFAQAYLGHSVCVKYNGMEMPAKNINDFAACIAGAGAQIISGTVVPDKKMTEADRVKAVALATSALTLNPSSNPSRDPLDYQEFANHHHPWNIALVTLFPADDTRPTAIRVGDLTYKPISIGGINRQLGMVNGVETHQGNHITKLTTDIVDELNRVVISKIGHSKSNTDKLKNKQQKNKPASATKATTSTPKEAREIRLADVFKNSTLIMSGIVPGACWDGQRKEKLSILSERLRNMRMDNEFLKKISDILLVSLLEQKTKKAEKDPEIDKYTPATVVRDGKRNDASLIILEGDSAIAFVNCGLTSNVGKKSNNLPTIEHFGYMSTGGVVMNALTEVTQITKNGREMNIATLRLRENVFFQNLVRVLNLNFNCTYEDDKDFATLRYRNGVIICVDQDLDGAGKIAALLEVFFHTFWPALLRRGYIYRFLTPVIRVYNRSSCKGAKARPVQEFLYEEQYRDWAIRTFGGVDAVPGNLVVRYYKGLAAHNTGYETNSIFEKFYNYCYRIGFAPDDSQLLCRIFGAETDFRKSMLRAPAGGFTPEEIHYMEMSREFPYKVHVNREIQLYKLYAVRRQIPGIADGQTPGQRKVINTIMYGSVTKGDVLKVFQLGGTVAKEMHYHHGDASLNATIMNLAMLFTGARQCPFILPQGQAGSRFRAGKDAGSARYVGVYENSAVKCLFSQGDRYVLDYTDEDGCKAEPVTFVFPFPVHLLEGRKIPSEGFATFVLPRKFDGLCNLIRATFTDPEIASMIALDPDAPIGDSAKRLAERYPLEFGVVNYRGACLEGEKNDFVMTGVAEFAEVRGATVVRITEVLLLKEIDKYIKKLREIEGVVRVDNNCGPDSVDIVVHLQVNTLKELINEYTAWHASAYEQVLVGTQTVYRFCTLSRSEQIDVMAKNPLLARFGLVKRGRQHLNFTYPGGQICECHTYHDVYIIWARYRLRLYIRRLERQYYLEILRTLLDAAVLRYFVQTGPGVAAGVRAKFPTAIRIIELFFGEHATAEWKGVAGTKDEAILDAELTQAGYPRLPYTIIERPEYRDSSQLFAIYQKILGQGAGTATTDATVPEEWNFGYIHRIQVRHTTLDNALRLAQTVENNYRAYCAISASLGVRLLNTDIDYARGVMPPQPEPEKPFPGASIWRDEAEKIIAVLAKVISIAEAQHVSMGTAWLELQ